MTTNQFFEKFLAQVKQTSQWAIMEKTVEGSHWHREDNVAVHTQMTINVYLAKFAHERTPRQQMIALMALLFHDFGKPEAETEKPRADGTLYNTYAGHEPVSANEFMSFICDHHDLRNQFFEQGFTWTDIRSIKVMIEHHLPYSLKNVTKRLALRSMIAHTLGADEVCFYDMLRSDGLGRISDDHEAKTKSVEEWITEFRVITVPVAKTAPGKTIIKQPQKTMMVLYGVSGAGKSTWVSKLKGESFFEIAAEDAWRLEYAQQHLDEIDLSEWPRMTTAEQYDAAWKFCHMSKLSKYDAFAKQQFAAILESGKHIVLDRMNQGRKGRGSWITAAKACGYRIESVEFYISEQVAKDRQATRGDKRLPDHRVHQIYMQQETPWYGPEVDAFRIVI